MAKSLTDQELLEAAPSEFVHANSAMQMLWLLPQNLLIAGLRVYRALVSPLYGDVCKHFPTCSAYGLEAVVRHGAVRGLGLTVRRLLRCHPWAAGGIDRVPDAGRRFVSESELPKILLLNHPTPEDRSRLLASVPADSTIAGQRPDKARRGPSSPASPQHLTDAA